MKPKISIITPAYNRAHLLSRAWSSLRCQTVSNFQWIIVDDGSIDNTPKIVEAFADSRITYIWQHNSGVNAARNRGHREVLADFIIYLDSDDELLNESTLEVMLDEIRGARPEIAWVAFTVVDNEGNPGLYHLSSDRIEAGYLDHICEQKLWGEFFPIYRRDTVDMSAWPPYNGCEVLRHWRIIKYRPALLVNRPALLVNRPARTYHKQGGDNLTGAHAVIRRSASMAEAVKELISEHQSAWLRSCPCQLGKYSFYRAMYLALSTFGYRTVPDLLSAIWYGKLQIKVKALMLLLIALIIPMGSRKWLFTKWANI